MADTRQTLDIPHGVSFTISDNTISLGNEADVVIRGDLGYKMKRVFSNEGNVQILPPEGSVLTIEDLEAPNGDVHIQGHVNTKNIRAKKIYFDEGFLRADKIHGEEEVHLKGKRFQILYTKSPAVYIDSEAKGLALVVECKHEVPEGRFMGGFPNMEEAKKTFSSFMDMFGGDAGAATMSATTPPAAKSTPAAQPSATESAATDEGAAEEGTSEQIKKFFQKT